MYEVAGSGFDDLNNDSVLAVVLARTDNLHAVTDTEPCG
jgi:hypothetical protein